MLQTINSVPQEKLNKKLLKVGCYYVVSLKKGRRNIASLPQKTILEANQDFNFKFAMTEFKVGKIA
jgi:hypothetical protein